MYYTFEDDVYFVDGFVKGCIYDFKHGKLYSLNKDLSEKIRDINLYPRNYNDLSDMSLKNIISKFVDLGILKISNEHNSHDISEIKDFENDIKFAWIEVTNKCNLQCKHCYNESSIICNNVMSLNNFQLVVDSLVKLGVKNIQIIGGEPFIIGNLLKLMIDYAVGKFEKIEIFTNGTLVSKDWVDYLYRKKIFVAVSVYSYKGKIHDQVTRVDGSWEKTNECIAMLNNKGVKYRVANILMDGVEIGELNTKLYSLNDQHDIIRMSGRGNFSLLNDKLIRKKLITKKTFSVPITKEHCRRFVGGHNCFKNKIYVASNLDVFPCAMERRMVHCVVSNKNGITLNDDICRFNKDMIKECKHCEYRYACHDCRPNSLSDDIYAKPWFCTYDPFIGEWYNVDKFICELHKKWDNK